MKKVSVIALVFSLMLSSLLSSCSKNDFPAKDVSSDQLKSSVVDQDWKIATLKDDGKDHTQRTDGFLFRFTSDGMVKASKGSESYEGSWYVETDDSGPELKLHLYFSQPTSFEKLNEDWELYEMDSNRIVFRDHHRNPDELVLVR